MELGDPPQCTSSRCRRTTSTPAYWHDRDADLYFDLLGRHDLGSPPNANTVIGLATCYLVTRGTDASLQTPLYLSPALRADRPGLTLLEKSMVPVLVARPMALAPAIHKHLHLSCQCQWPGIPSPPAAAYLSNTLGFKRHIRWRSVHALAV